MRSESLLTLFAAALAVATTSSRHESRADETKEDLPLLKAEDQARVVPGRFIVEFEPSSDRQAAARSLNSRKGYKIKKTFENSDLFFGASVEAADDEDAMSVLTNDASVARVWPLRQIKLIKNVGEAQNFSDVVDAIDYNIHGPTGVEAMHKKGYFGEGATVAVVDTGIDYTHPGIGGGFGPEFTVIGGTDLVGDGCWPADECPLEPDDDPMDYHGHGTHVAGIIAGQSKFFTGVAPKAKLLAYKVFSTAGWVLEDTLIEAFLDAYNNDADVITASIGALNGWQDTAWAVVSDRLVENGVVITIAAGNDGNYGPFMFSDGSAGRNVLGIAATEPDYVPQTALEVSFNFNGTTNDTRMGHYPRQQVPWPTEIQDWPVVSIGAGCDFPEDLDLTNKVALVERYFCSPVDKEARILAAGGKYIFLFDPVEPDNDGWYIGDWGVIHFAALAPKDGQALSAALDDGYKIKVSVPKSNTIVGMPNTLAGPSYFTSFGGTYDLAVKPDIGAPGSAILSLYLDHGFVAMDGTSMATPYVAGVAALYIGKNGGRAKNGKGFGKMLAARILASGSPVPWVDHLGMPVKAGVPASVAQAGNGLVNATKVLMSETQLSFTKFALNDTHRFSRYQGVEITNNSPNPVTYTFDVEAAGAFEAFEFDYNGYPLIKQRKQLVNDMIEIKPEVRMPAGTHKLAPGQTKRVEFIFQIPDGMNYKNMPVYSGKVIVKGSNGERLSVPYMGTGGNTGKETRNQIWFRAIGYPSMVTNYDDDIKDKHTFTFNTSLEAQDFPKLAAAVNYGSPEMRWDVFTEEWREHEWKYPPVVGKNGYVGSIASWTGSNNAIGTVFDPEYDSVDDVIPWPFERTTRNVLYSAWWLGRLANGSDIAPGKYNMRIAALAPMGNPQASDNWDRFQTPMIEVVAE